MHLCYKAVMEEDFIVHSSHNAIDVSDVTYLHDLMCGECFKTDEQLVEPCPSNPYWQVII